MHDPMGALRSMAQTQQGGGQTQGIVEIVGDDLEAMLAFYAALGFEVERRTGPFAVLAGYGLRLFVAEDPAARSRRRWANLRILVDDVDRVWACVSALGLPTGNVVGDRAYGLRDFLVVDPAGFEIRFAQWLA